MMKLALMRTATGKEEPELHIKSNCISHMRRTQPYSEMLTYKPLTNNAVLRKSLKQ